MGKLTGTVAIVTGAGRGIGREIAKAFAREGAAVAVAARTAVEVQKTCADIDQAGGRALCMLVDVTDRWEVDDMVHRVTSELGPPDVLMNNAGSFSAIGPVVSVDPEMWWHDVTVNLLGPFLCAKAVLPGMVERKRGTIINMIGGGTGSPFPYGSGYGSSKAALMRLTESLDAEVAESGLRVFAMGPGLVRTAMTELQITTPEGKRWLPRIEEAFDQDHDVPPTRAASLAVELASGRLDALHGRVFGVGDDLDALLADSKRIVKEDLKTLRIVDTPRE